MRRGVLCSPGTCPYYAYRQAGCPQAGSATGGQCSELISEYVLEGRKANSILLDAYGLAKFKNPNKTDIFITAENVREVLRSARLTHMCIRK
jgi:ATP-dependent Lon protease